MFSVLGSCGLQPPSLKLPSNSLWAFPIHFLNQSSEELALPGWCPFPLLPLHSWLLPGTLWPGLSLCKDRCCSCTTQDSIEHEPVCGENILVSWTRLSDNEMKLKNGPRITKLSPSPSRSWDTGQGPGGAFPSLQGQVGSGSCLLLSEPMMFGSRTQDDKHRLYFAPVFFCGPLKWLV